MGLQAGTTTLRYKVLKAFSNEERKKNQTFSVDRNKRRSLKDNDLVVDRNVPSQWPLEKSIMLNGNEE